MPSQTLTGVTSTNSVGTLSTNVVNGPTNGARTSLVVAELRKIYIARKPTSADRVVYANED